MTGSMKISMPSKLSASSANSRDLSDYPRKDRKRIENVLLDSMDIIKEKTKLLV